MRDRSRSGERSARSADRSGARPDPAKHQDVSEVKGAEAKPKPKAFAQPSFTAKVNQAQNPTTATNDSQKPTKKCHNNLDKALEDEDGDDQDHQIPSIVSDFPKATAPEPPKPAATSSADNGCLFFVGGNNRKQLSIDTKAYKKV